MIISSWNVNSVRARIENITDYIKKYSPDILMIQEIKTEEINFPFDAFNKLKYESYVFGQKSYNGVAILSKNKIQCINTNLINDNFKQSRIISGDISIKKKIIKLINIYVPNGNPVDTEKYTYKINWLNSLIKQLKNLLKKNKNIILGGDFNIIPSTEDVYNPKSFEDDALFKLEVRKKLRELVNLGFHDIYRYFNNDKHEYTFWDYQAGSWQKNNGMRIDHFLISNNLINNVVKVNINKIPRSKVKPSDHTPIEIEIN
jgi:exodeoxyribonuclease-3